MSVSKYDYLSQKYFGKPYYQLDNEEQIEIEDLYNGRNE
jgi:hypothetical protein